MDPLVQEVTNVALRWLHVLFAIAWVGYAYFIVISWTPVSLKLAPELRGAVGPLLIERVLPFFRLVAVLTWVTGVLLLGLVYWHGGLMVSAAGGSSGAAIGAGVAALLFSFFAYDGAYKSPLGKMGPAAAAVCCLLLTGLAFGLAQVMTGRAMFLHLGGTLGTIMLMNAAMRLAPAQKKMVAMMKGEMPFDPQVAGLIAQRAGHNAVLSVAVVAYMLSFHLPSAYGHELAWAIAAGLGVACLAAGKALLDMLVPAAPPPPAAAPRPASP
jgi:uncharacterized membrane protein